jgi:hypothetical protein
MQPSFCIAFCTPHCSVRKQLACVPHEEQSLVHLRTLCSNRSVPLFDTLTALAASQCKHCVRACLVCWRCCMVYSRLPAGYTCEHLSCKPARRLLRALASRPCPTCEVQAILFTPTINKAMHSFAHAAATACGKLVDSSTYCNLHNSPIPHTMLSDFTFLCRPGLQGLRAINSARQSLIVLV